MRIVWHRGQRRDLADAKSDSGAGSVSFEEKPRMARRGGSHGSDQPSSGRGRGVAGRKGYETAVGFKYIGALMESEPIIVGGEESGGLSVKGHVPEKDGILACLLMAELVATEKKSLGAILKAA